MTHWFLFIDDERDLADVTWVNYTRATNPWRVARNLQQVLELIDQHGMPLYVSFDHDLGDGEPTGFDIAKLLVDGDMDEDHRRHFPPGFDFVVHSQNPVGAENIRKYLDNYLEFKQIHTIR